MNDRRSTGWGRRGLQVAAGLLLGAMATTAAAGDSLRQRTEEEARVLEALARGQDVSEDLSRLAEESGSRAGGPVLPPTSRTGERLAGALERLAGAAEPSNLAAAFEAFAAQDLLIRQELHRARQILERGAIGGEVLARLEATEADYLSASDRLHDTLGSALGEWRRARSARSSSSLGTARAAVVRAAAEVVEVLARQRPREPVSVLRTAPLPYRRSQLGPRALQIPQTLLPSYLDPAAAAPGSAKTWRRPRRLPFRRPSSPGPRASATTRWPSFNSSAEASSRSSTPAP